MLREELPGCCGKKKAKVVIEENHYELGGIIGQGTFGKVYSAIDIRTGARVAIKQVYQDKRFKNRQLEVISRLDNDNVSFMKDYYFINKKQDRFLYLVMDFYETNLQGILKLLRKEKKMMDQGVRKIITFQIFKALYYLQNNNVCHRDLKPPNILVDPSTYQIRICDFGSAKIFDKSEKNVAYICSRYYRAPELLFQYTHYRTQIDIWSAGCIVVQLITREPIFPGDSTIEQLIQIMKVMGSPTKQYLEKYASELNNQIVLPQVPATGWARVLKRYNPDPQLIDLISKILIYDIQLRFTPLQALKHKYFHDLASQKYLSFTSKLPNLFQFNRLRTPKNSKDILDLQEIFMESYRLSHGLYNKKSNEAFKLQTSDSTPQAGFSVNQKVNKQQDKLLQGMAII